MPGKKRPVAPQRQTRRVGTRCVPRFSYESAVERDPGVDIGLGHFTMGVPYEHCNLDGERGSLRKKASEIVRPKIQFSNLVSYDG
jgi:hypothetical protein